jgi:putative ABC transport system permease protein
MTFKIALRALARNKLRAFLTMLGIIIGVGAVIAMVAIGEGAKSTIRSQISALGTNVLIILPAATSRAACARAVATSIHWSIPTRAP